VQTVSDDVSLQSSATGHEIVLILVSANLWSRGLVLSSVLVSPVLVLMSIYKVQKVLLDCCLEKRIKPWSVSAKFLHSEVLNF
jgi:hypothetical protein